MAFFPAVLSEDGARVQSGLLRTDADFKTVSDELKALVLEVVTPHLLKINSIEPVDRVLGTNFVFPRRAL